MPRVTHIHDYRLITAPVGADPLGPRMILGYRCSCGRPRPQERKRFRQMLDPAENMRLALEIYRAQGYLSPWRGES